LAWVHRLADVVALGQQARAAADEARAEEFRRRLREALGGLGEAQKAAEGVAEVLVYANVSDPHSRMMKAASGWVQGYNAQAAVDEDHQVVVAAVLSQDRNDVGLYRPVLDAVASNLEAVGVDAKIKVVTADAGYWSEQNAEAAEAGWLIATSKDWKQREAARRLGQTSGDPPEGASLLEAMEHRLRTEEGAAAYARRSSTVEPVFGQSKENRRIRGFMRRGLAAVTSEWALICTTRNINKIISYCPGSPISAFIPP
jgi:hypothetical protein